MLQRVLTIVVILVLVLGGGYYAYQQLVPPPEEEAQGPIYATQPVVRGDISVGVDTSGFLNPSSGGGIQIPYNPKMGPGAPGNFVIEEVLVEEGDEVKQGQVLVRLGGQDIQSQIELVETQLEADRQALADLLNVPVDEIYRVDPTSGITLRAPIDGRVVGLQVEEGKKLEQGQIVAQVVNDSHFRLTAKLAAAEFNRVSEGDTLLLSFSQFDGAVEATVKKINPNPVPEAVSSLTDGGGSGSAERYTWVYWVELEAKNPGLVRPGMKARVGKGDPDGSVDWFMYNSVVDGFVDEEKVFSSIDAIATHVHVQEMQMVKKGDAIVTLAGEDARDVVRGRLEQIQENEAKLRDLRAQLNNLEIKAPMDGVVADINAQPGQSRGPGEWLGSIYNTSEMRMGVEVDDVDIVLVKQGSPVDVTVDAVPGQVFKGRVEHVSTMGRDQNGIARFYVSISVEGGPQLRPGMQAQAHIDAGSAEDVLLVPLEAIFEEDGQSKVEVLQPDGIPKVVTVQLGLMNDRYAEVKSGLEEGQLVITGSSADLLPSQHIGSKDSLLPTTPPDNGGNEPPGPAPAPDVRR